MSSVPHSTKHDGAIQQIANLILTGRARKIVVLTGAGISTSAGIPDFRSPDTGLYHNLQKLDLPFPEAVFELGFFKRNPKPFWTLAKELYPGKFLPTPTHYFLQLLSTHSLLLRLFTQNIDTLEHLTGLSPSKIIEAHGSFASAHCLSCGKPASREYVLSAGVRKGEIVRCGEFVRKAGRGSDGAQGAGQGKWKWNGKGQGEGEREGKGEGYGNERKKCGGLVKPDIVFFGEGLPNKFFRSLEDLPRADLLIVLGTSLQVHPFASLVNYVGKSTPRVLINREAVGPFEGVRRDRPCAPVPSSTPGSREPERVVESIARRTGEDIEATGAVNEGRQSGCNTEPLDGPEGSGHGRQGEVTIEGKAGSTADQGSARREGKDEGEDKDEDGRYDDEDDDEDEGEDQEDDSANSDNSDDSPSDRDWYWEGDCDEAIWKLAEALGWKTELEDLIASGRENLEKEWSAASTDGTTPVADTDSTESIVQDIPSAARDSDRDAAGSRGEKGEMDELRKAIDKALHL